MSAVQQIATDTLAKRPSRLDDPALDGSPGRAPGDDEAHRTDDEVESKHSVAYPQVRRASKDNRGWRHVVRNFSPSWFSVTMGTGIVAYLFGVLPWDNRGLYWCCVVFFILNTALFFTALLLSLVRYLGFRGIWTVMIHDPNSSLFLATIPMGFATLVDCWVIICVPIMGPAAKTAAVVFWVIDAACAVATTFYLPFQLMSRDEIHSLDRITAAQLLPIAATVIAAGLGAEVALVQDSPDRVVGIAIASVFLLGMALPLSYTILVTYYHRLAVHKLPAREVIVSAFLPLGPCSYGGIVFLLLGEVALKHLPASIERDNPMAGNVLHAVSIPIALMLWGFGTLWLLYAIAAIYRSWPLPFNMGWWGFVFPLGVYAACAIQIGEELDVSFFRYIGTILSACVFALWLLVAVNTVRGSWTRQLFYAPCLQNLKTAAAVPELADVEAHTV